VQGQVGDQVVERALPAGELDRAVELKCRRQQPLHDDLRQGIHHADAKRQRPIDAAPGDGGLHLRAQAKDLLRVTERGAPEFGQRDAAPGRREQPPAERALQRPQLAGDGLRRQEQDPGGAIDAALARDDPEVVQVVVVEPAHATTRNLLGCRLTKNRFLFISRLP
jgi:hypothetical protein